MKKIIRKEHNGILFTNKAGFDKRKKEAKQSNLQGHLKDLKKGEKPSVRAKLFS